MIIIIICAAFLFACNNDAAEKQSGQPGGVARIAINGNIESLFPLNAEEFHAAQIIDYMLSPALVAYTEGFEPQPLLASDWHIAPDNQSILYELNREVHWSNGNPLTAEDILFSWETIRNFGHTSVLNHRLENIESIVVPDSFKVRVHFTNAVADPLLSSKMPVFPVEWSEIKNNDRTLEQLYEKDFIGCGPFLLESFNGDSLVMRANRVSEYQQPLLDAIVIYFVGSVDEMRDLIKNKRVDMAVDLPISLAPEIRADSGYKLTTYPERGYNVLAWNLKNRFLKNRDVRYALSMAIDRETLSDGVLGGFSTIVDGPVYPSFPYTYNDLPQIPFAPEQADSLLNAAGFRDVNDDGIREMDGEPIHLNLLINKENPIRSELAVNIRSNLQHVGIEIDILEVDWETYLKCVRVKDFDVALLTWVDNDRYDPSPLFHSNSIEGGLNVMSYNNPLADALMEQGLTSTDPEIRARAWKRFQQLLAQDIPVTFLFCQRILTAVSKNLKNVQVDGRGYLVNVKEWWLGKR